MDYVSIGSNLHDHLLYIVVEGILYNLVYFLSFVWRLLFEIIVHLEAISLERG